jgi:hypothetical protein
MCCETKQAAWCLTTPRLFLTARLFACQSFVADGRHMNHRRQYTCQGRNTHRLNALFLQDTKGKRGEELNVSPSVFALVMATGEVKGTKVEDSHLREVMLDGIARGGAARIDPQLPIDRLDMHIDGVWAEDELLGYLLLGEPQCQQAQHLDFPRC